MRGLLKLVVVAVIAYFAYTEGLPLLKQKLEPTPAAAVESERAGRCVSRARDASRVLADHLRQFAQPPVDPGAWAAALVHTAGELSTADGACRCSEPACRPASRALAEMRKLLDQFDRAVRGDGSGFGNPAAYREEIDRLLDNAEAALP